MILKATTSLYQPLENTLEVESQMNNIITNWVLPASYSYVIYIFCFLIIAVTVILVLLSYLIIQNSFALPKSNLIIFLKFGFIAIMVSILLIIIIFIVQLFTIKSPNIDKYDKLFQIIKKQSEYYQSIIDNLDYLTNNFDELYEKLKEFKGCLTDILQKQINLFDITFKFNNNIKNNLDNILNNYTLINNIVRNIEIHIKNVNNNTNNIYDNYDSYEDQLNEFNSYDFVNYSNKMNNLIVKKTNLQNVFSKMKVNTNSINSIYLEIVHLYTALNGIKYKGGPFFQSVINYVKRQFNGINENSNRNLMSVIQQYKALANQVSNLEDLILITKAFENFTSIYAEYEKLNYFDQSQTFSSIDDYLAYINNKKMVFQSKIHIGFNNFMESITKLISNINIVNPNINMVVTFISDFNTSIIQNNYITVPITPDNNTIIASFQASLNYINDHYLMISDIKTAWADNNIDNIILKMNNIVSFKEVIKDNLKILNILDGANAMISIFLKLISLNTDNNKRFFSPFVTNVSSINMMDFFQIIINSYKRQINIFKTINGSVVNFQQYILEFSNVISKIVSMPNQDNIIIFYPKSNIINYIQNLKDFSTNITKQLLSSMNNLYSKSKDFENSASWYNVSSLRLKANFNPLINFNSVNSPFIILEATDSQLNLIQNAFTSNTDLNIISITNSLQNSKFVIPSISKEKMINLINIYMINNYNKTNGYYNYLLNNLTITNTIKNKMEHIYDTFFVIAKKIPALRAIIYILFFSNGSIISKELVPINSLEQIFLNLPSFITNLD